MNNEGTLKSEDILIITPDLSLNGANVVLMELLHLFQKENRTLWLLASEDGPFREILSNMQIQVVISPFVKSNEVVELLKHDFRCVFLNSSSVHYYALLFQNQAIPVYWWFHESYEQLNVSRDNFVHLGMLSSNFKFLAVTQKVVRGLAELYGVDAELLPMPVADCSLENGEMYHSKYREHHNNKIVFFIPAAYTRVKGQDVLCRAICMLPDVYREKSEFVFAGYKLAGQDEYFSIIQKMGRILSNVKILGEIPREEVYEYYKKCDCVIAPSRADSTPTTIVEAMMFGRLCVVSDGTGMADYITDCVDGFIFENENAEQLANILMAIMDNLTQLGPIADAGRVIYEKRFTPMVVEQQMKQLMKI